MRTDGNLRGMQTSRGRPSFWAIALLVTLGASAAHTQGFDSGSTGADGALSFACDPGGEVIEWDAAGFDADGDRVFEFTTITVPSACTIRLTSRQLGLRPLVWLATGDVLINGTLDLSGEPGHGNGFGDSRFPALPGPGGFPGGLGTVGGIGAVTAGLGPGGAEGGPTGAGAGHVVKGNNGSGSLGGDPYGNPFLLPLIGGSGGGGASLGGGGGAGGGAILIASSTEIRVNGVIRSNAGAGTRSGGQGSGGAIRLVAPSLRGAGQLRVENAGFFGTVGSGGRVRMEALDNGYTGNVFLSGNGEVRAVTLAPDTILVSGLAIPSLRVTTVNGIPVPLNPTGGFTPADVTFDSAAPVLIEIEATDVPVGTIVHVDIHSETEGTMTVDSTPLAGTEALSMATASAAFSSGFSLVTLRASFEP